MCIRYELDVVWRGWEMQLVPRHIMRWEKEKGGGGHQWRTGERGRLQAHSRLYFTPQQSLFYTTAVSHAVDPPSGRCASPPGPPGSPPGSHPERTARARATIVQESAKCENTDFQFLAAFPRAREKLGKSIQKR